MQVRYVCKQEALLPQNDRATHYISQNPVHCLKKLYNKLTTNYSMELEGYS